MNELIKVDYTSENPTVSARELHDFLEVDTPYRLWFPRTTEYGFAEGTDYTPYIFVHPQNGQPTEDAALSIDMAKEICMIQRNEKGKQARQYFIQLEKDWNSPEKVMARALRIAEKELMSLKATNARLSVSNALMAPKAEFFDELVDRNMLTSFRETAKEFKVGERDLVRFLVEKKYIYRDKKGKLMPYAEKNDGLFEVKECFNEKTNWSGTQTLVTPKGRETFQLLYIGKIA